MLEIAFLIFFGKKLAELASEKGHSKGWAALGVGFWIGGEVMGLVLGALLGLEGLGAYPLALGVGAAGAGVAFLVVKSLPNRLPEP